MSENEVRGSDPADAWRLLETVNEWVRYADLKASTVLAGAGVVAGALLAAGQSERFSEAPGSVVLLMSISAILTIVAAGLALWCLLPTFRVGEPRSLIYFEHVARRFSTKEIPAPGAAPKEHARALEEMFKQEPEYFSQLSGQIWANSTVAHRKLLWGGCALVSLGLAVILGGAAAICSLIA